MQRAVRAALLPVQSRRLVASRRPTSGSCITCMYIDLPAALHFMHCTGTYISYVVRHVDCTAGAYLWNCLVVFAYCMLSSIFVYIYPFLSMFGAVSYLHQGIKQSSRLHCESFSTSYNKSVKTRAKIVSFPGGLPLHPARDTPGPQTAPIPFCFRSP